MTGSIGSPAGRDGARHPGGNPTDLRRGCDTGTAVGHLPAAHAERETRALRTPHDRKIMDLDIDALETSFDHIALRGDELMDLFCERPFAAAPSVPPLFFGADMKRVKGMLLVALVLLRKSLRDLES